MLTHLPDPRLRISSRSCLSNFLKFGSISVTSPWKLPTAHHIMGGLGITMNAETTLPCLYACGEVSGGFMVQTG